MSDETIPPFARGAINLASPRLGAKVIFATDEFFAPKERLLKDEAPVFHPDAYDEHGKWMDGWETRRRRGGGHDFCIVRLGAKGLFSGIDIDTRHFTGNHPAAASIDGALSDADPDPDTAWAEILPRRPLAPDRHNFFEIGAAEPFNFLRVNIYPDGGLARLRVYGSPVCEWRRQDPQGIHELSAVANGGHVIAYSDAHYGDPWVMLTPGRGANMGDGWETRRRREPGNDWILIALGAAGTVERIEVDTAHFKGNYPDACSVQAALLEGDAAATDGAAWPELMARQKLEMDRIHHFEGGAISKTGPVSHVRLNIFPDGGISRFRVFGRLAR